MKREIYIGDNLDILRRYIPGESIDLIYLDPPFNSNRQYNELFTQRHGVRAAAQTVAFGDTWEWNATADHACQVMTQIPGKLGESVAALYRLLGAVPMMAYVAMMAPRLIELRRVLRATGSIYLHCDPTTSHYLKMLMDAIFGPQNPRWTPENRPVVDGSKPASRASAPSTSVVLQSRLRVQGPEGPAAR